MSNSLLNHEFDQVRNSAAITPFVVVPTHELEESLVKLDSRTRVEHRRCLRVDKVRADNLVGGILQDTFQISLAGLFHRRTDLSIAGIFGCAYGKINHRNCRGGHSERHARELAFDLGDNESNSFGGAGS